MVRSTPSRSCVRSALQTFPIALNSVPPTYIEIDQSGQIGRLNTDTVFAFSNHIREAIVISAAVKREAYDHIKARYEYVRDPYLTLFAAGIFLLIKDHISKIDRILIDEEFSGKEADIRGRLLTLIQKVSPTFTKNRIVFWRIGKRSGAHEKAYAVYKTRRREGHFNDHEFHVVTLKELLKVLEIK